MFIFYHPSRNLVQKDLILCSFILTRGKYALLQEKKRTNNSNAHVILYLTYLTNLFNIFFWIKYKKSSNFLVSFQIGLNLFKHSK